MTIPAEQARKRRFGVLRTIALYKLVKVLLLLGVAYGELRLRDASLAAKLLSWAQTRPYGLEHRIVGQLLEWFSGLSVSRIYALRIVTLAYAAIFSVEGISLWMEKRWGEWLTTIITASLVPLEAWEIFFRPTIGKVLILLANIAVVGYLVWHVRKTRTLRQPSIVK
ncbi:MAG TPA: DUF2127 domain-containing protein [Steroidobacteraceae bacterium]|jgi:uncharacterized membrane protein (DUF2068 family)|nr:DUF2127 domain-containing protein [Steroidobacteraceae bacterium]